MTKTSSEYYKGKVLLLTGHQVGPIQSNILRTPLQTKDKLYRPTSRLAKVIALGLQTYKQTEIHTDRQMRPNTLPRCFAAGKCALAVRVSVNIVISRQMYESGGPN